MACFALPPSGNAVPAAFLLGAGDSGFAAAFAAHGGHREERVLLTDSGSTALYVAMRGVAAQCAATRGPAAQRAAMRGMAGQHAAPGGEAVAHPLGRVAVPAWCCPSVPQAVIQAGLQPVLVDIDPHSLNYASASLEAARAHPAGLAAVVLVHFFGIRPPRPGGLKQPGGAWDGAIFVRDCAQDFDYRPEPGDDSPCVYSFGRGKALNAGHGGALCLPEAGPLAEACRAAWEALPVSGARPWPKALAINALSHPRLFWALSALPGLGIGTTVWHAPLGFARMAPSFARLGSACLEAWLQRRDFYRNLIDRYRSLAGDCDPAMAFAPSAVGSRGEPGMPVRFPLLIRDPDLRASLYRRTRARYGGVTRMYPAALPGLPGAPAGLEAAGDFPGARRVAEEILTLPVTAALMGREARFLDFLAGILAEKGALRYEPASGAFSSILASI
jgi:dTDP-4-amino-4,6-dideoxygalactose transaminase